MRNSRFLTLALFLVLLLFAPNAFGYTYTVIDLQPLFTISSPLQTTFSESPFTVNVPRWAQLNSVTITLGESLAGQSDYTDVVLLNNASITFNIAGEVTLQGLGIDPQLTVSTDNGAGKTAPLAITGAGGSQGTISDTASVSPITVVLHPGDTGFDSFVGTGDLGLTLVGSGLVGAFGSRVFRLDQVVSLQNTIDLTITYDYDIPEPATMVTMGAGLLILGFLGRRKFRKP